MIITSLNDTFTWCGIRWDVHTVAESTTCTIWVSKACFKHCPNNEPSSTVAYVRERCMFFMMMAVHIFQWRDLVMVQMVII